MIEKSLEEDVHISEMYVLHHRHDNELHNATEFKTSILERSLSKALYKNSTMKGFLDLLQPMIVHMITANAIARNWLNFGVSKFYDRYPN